LQWVHNVEVHSFLLAYRRYGGSLSTAEADRYVDEMARAAELVGLHRDDVPHSLGHLREYLRDARGLAVTPAARAAMWTVLNPRVPLALVPLKSLWAVPGAAAVGLLPRRLRALYGIPYVAPA